MTPPEEQTFQGIFARLARVVQDDAAARGVDVPTMQHPAVAGASLSALPREALLGLDDDTDFVVACYLLLVDRPPYEKELAWRLRRMRRGNATRELILEEIVTGWAVTQRGSKVVYT